MELPDVPATEATQTAELPAVPQTEVKVPERRQEAKAAGEAQLEEPMAA